jgi:hypothetical protein
VGRWDVAVGVAMALGLAQPVIAEANSVPAGETPDSRDQDIFGEKAPVGEKALTSDSDMSKRLIDSLQVGGRLEVRTDYGQLEKQNAAGTEAGQLKQADVYFDTRPNKDLRGFLRLRFSEASGIDAQTPLTPNTTPCTGSCLQTDIDEMWFKWNMHDTVYATLGKQHVKWGSGRIWNPTDFTAAQVVDPLALFDRRLGVDMIKLNLPFEKQGYNFYAILEYQTINQVEQVSGALRGEFAFLGVGEAAVSFQVKAHSPIRAGLDISSGLGPIDVHTENAFIKREQQLLYRGDVSPTTGQLPTSYEKSDKWFLQSVSGIEHTFKYNSDNSVTVGGEYFFNQLGYDTRDLELYSLITGQSPSLYGGSHYAAAYINLPNPGNWTETSFYLNGIKNLSDKTSVIRLTGSWLLYKDAEIQGFVGECQGDYGELCFRVPESFKALGALPGIPPILAQTVQALPTRRTKTTGGLGVVLKF